MDFSKLTLGELLTNDHADIRRHAVGILKALQKMPHACWICGVKINKEMPHILHGRALECLSHPLACPQLSHHDPRTCENSIPCFDCEAIK